MKYKIEVIVYFTLAGIATLTLPFAVQQAFEERGYFAIGSEWVLLLLAILNVISGIHNLIRYQNEEIKKQSERHRISMKRVIKNILKG